MGMIQVMQSLLNAQPHQESVTATDGIATFDTDFKAPIKAVIPFEPKQDLHGYDHPWPAGGGKNLFDEDGADWVEGYVISATGEIVENNGWKYSREFLPIEPSTTYTIQFNKEAISGAVAAANHIAYYDINKTFIERHELVAGNITGDLTATFTTPSNCAYYRLTMARTGITNVQIETGNTASAYEPYENICSIDGWTGCTVKNDKQFIRFIPRDESSVAHREINGISVDYLGSGKYSIKGTATAKAQFFTYLVPALIPSGEGRIMELNNTQQRANIKLYFYNIDSGSSFDNWTLTPANRTSTGYVASAGKTIRRFEINIPSGQTVDMTIQPQFRVTKDEQVIPVLFTNPSTGNPMTVYGGTLDVTNGVLTVEYGLQTFDGVSAVAHSGKKFTAKGANTTRDEFYLDFVYIKKTRLAGWDYYADQNVICNAARKCLRADINTTMTVLNFRIINGLSYSQPRLMFPLSWGINTVANANAYINELYKAGNPITYTYPLATPITYHFDSVGQLKSFLGQNNLWCDLNGNPTVKYWKHG